MSAIPAFPFPAMTKEEWSFGFHDATPTGWILTVGYLAAAFLSFLATRNRGEKDRPASRIWLVLAVGLVFLAVNKQLDIQNWLRFAGRDLTRAFGIYDYKFLIRAVLLVLMVGAALAGTLRWRRHVVPFLRRRPVLVCGLAALGTFVALRAMKVPNLNAPEPGGLQAGHWPGLIEAAGLVLMGLAAWRR